MAFWRYGQAVLVVKPKRHKAIMPQSHKTTIPIFSLKQLKHHEITNIKTTFPIVVLCDNFHSPQNVGMAFRICEIMGVEHLYLLGSSPIPPSAKIKKTARNAENMVPFSAATNEIELIQRLKKEGYSLIGMEITDKSKSIYEWEGGAFEKIALLFGAERNGISEELLPLLDHCFHIPMYGQISSMNVIMAMSISLYEITKQVSSSLKFG